MNNIADELLKLAERLGENAVQDQELLCNAALLIDKKNYFANKLLGQISAKKGNYQQALNYYSECEQVAPASMDLAYTMGNAYLEIENYTKAIEYYKEAIGQKEFPEAMLNMALAYNKIGSEEKYVEILEKITISFPWYFPAFHNLGVFWYGKCELDKSISSYLNALRIEPESKITKFNLSLAYLMAKDYQTGFAYYENRWGVSPNCPIRNFDSELWVGQEINVGASTIIITTEQGFGDLIQMSRYLNLLKDKFQKIYLEVQPPIYSLMANSFPHVEVVKYGENFPVAEYYCPLMSLPFAFKTIYNTVPVYIRYLDCGSGSQNILNDNKNVKVGLCWQGSSLNPEMLHRSIKLSDLSNIFLNKNFEFYALSVDATKDDLDLIKCYKNVFNCQPLITDFLDTANIINNLDVMITVDTAVAHLSGALGIKTILLLNKFSDWRWHLNDTKSIWYPSMEIVRTSEYMDYDSIVETLSVKLAEIKKFY